MNMYYLALVAPEEIDRHVLAWKNRMKDLYGSVVALRSPAHITLIPPFWMNDELEEGLKQNIQSFTEQAHFSTVRLNGFSCFKPSVIFIDVEKDHWLIQLKSDLETYLLGLKTYPIKKDTRPYHPHVTIATRDLHKKQFAEAWHYFENRKYKAEWKAEGISLLRHNKKNWDVIFTSQSISN